MGPSQTAASRVRFGADVCSRQTVGQTRGASCFHSLDRQRNGSAPQWCPTSPRIADQRRFGITSVPAVIPEGRPANRPSRKVRDRISKLLLFGDDARSTARRRTTEQHASDRALGLSGVRRPARCSHCGSRLIGVYQKLPGTCDTFLSLPLLP